ncbi:MAG TPA: GGDEF domain-containing protein [Caulobacteraceae bacterium]|jgi:diguanylate cyclase (GGDEF)-like protein
MVFSSGWLNEDVDLAARDGSKSTLPRIVLGAASALILVMNFGLSVGAAWLAVNLAGEAYAEFARRRQVRGQIGTKAERLNYLFAAALLSAIWTCTTAFYWFSGLAGLKIVAIVIAAAQLMHAQAYAFRSKAVMVVIGAFPAAALIVMPLVFGGLTGAQLVSTILGIGLTLAYVGSGARASMAAAKALQDAQNELETIAYLDSLTHLANRRMFTEDFRHLAAFSRRHGTRFASVLIDLDRFKIINDTLGHDAGDALLVMVAERLRGVVRESDRLARLGGDEFAILLPDVHDGEVVEKFCHRLIQAFEAPLVVNGEKVRATPSVGVAIFPDHGENHDAIYKAADLALYEAKRGGRNTWREFKAAVPA